MERGEIPKEIKRWNWGACLLAPFWSIRHGVWLGLLSFIPLFGWIFPLILGARGNQKAWLKNPYEPLPTFLKRQKYWAIGGVVFWTLILLTFIVASTYTINYSEGFKQGFKLAHSNKRITEHFGNSIKKSSFFNGSYNYTITYPHPAILTVAFDAVGTKNQGHILFQWEKREGDWVATEVTLTDREGRVHPIVESPMLISSFFDEAPYNKRLVKEAINRMMEEQDGYIILMRSKENNDFMQTSIEVAEDRSFVFSVEYSKGYTKQNKQLYQAKTPIYNPEDLITLFSHYAAGDDSHIQSMKWNQLTSIIPQDPHGASFRFGETL